MSSNSWFRRSTKCGNSWFRRSTTCGGLACCTTPFVRESPRRHSFDSYIAVNAPLLVNPPLLVTSEKPANPGKPQQNHQGLGGHGCLRRVYSWVTCRIAIGARLQAVLAGSLGASHVKNGAAATSELTVSRPSHQWNVVPTMAASQFGAADPRSQS
jgi:hypothetical protein